MEIFIDKPDQLLKQVWSDKNIHIVEKEHFLGKDRICLIDISVNVQGQLQEQLFIDSAFYRANIRRGNTLVEITDKGKKKVIWGRKGTEKIIDIRLQHLQSVSRGLQLTKQEKKSFQYIFRNVNKCLQSGKRVQLLKTEKANGENAQVSYCYELNAWIICSKNVSLVAERQKDLQLYDGKRYSFAKVIAKQWFKEIEHLDKDKIKRLKKLLDGFTMVGQYCGNPDYQHLILYNEIKIIWFALIDNFTEQYCVDPFQVRKDIEEFGFRFVRLKRMGSWNEKKKFYRQLEDLYLRVAQAGIEDAEYGMEGAIVYFVSPELNVNKPYTKVLGAGKLKTIEYRFFRKIRQKISRYLNRKQAEPQLIRKYEQQCLELQKANNSTAPYPQHYYTQILKKGCQLIRQTKITEEFLRSKFVSVLKLLFYVIHKNVSLKTLGKKLVKNQKFLYQITKLSLTTFDTMGCSAKIVYVPVALPHVLNNKAQIQLANHFLKLNLQMKTIQCPNSNDDVQKIFAQINSSQTTDKQKTPFLLHFYINGSLKLQDIVKLNQKLKYKSKKDICHKIVLITDKISSADQSFIDTHQSQYPFRIETVLMSYWKGYQDVKNTPTIQQKINVLKKTTKQLAEKKDFIPEIQKNGLKKFEVQMSGSAKLSEGQKNQLKRFVSFIVNSQNQFENYCRLILKLQKYSQCPIPQQSEQDTCNEIKCLIKSSFSTVPEIDFMEKQ